MTTLKGAQKRYLRGLAHGLKPLVHIGKGGLTDGLFRSLDQALAAHELVKVKFLDFKDQKKEACREIDERLGCASVGTIGHLAIFYRAAEDPEDRKIRLPGA